MAQIKEPAREAFLYHLWESKNFDTRELNTIDGRKIEIRKKGVRNYDSGPDFLDALIFIENRLLRGNIEVHPVAGDWYAHRHHTDPRYNSVVLHVVTMNCPATFKTINQAGQIIPTINLDSFLDKKAEDLESEETIPVTPERGAGCGLKKKSMPAIQRVLEQAGSKRFMLRVQQFQEARQSESWEQIFYQSLLEALGYSKNQAPFRNLAKNLPVESLWNLLWNDSPELALCKCEAFMFGAAGLLPLQQNINKTALDAKSSSYIDQLECNWQDFFLRPKITIMKAEEWQFFRLRPQNFPTRRIAAAARLVLKFLDEGFIQTLVKVLSLWTSKKLVRIKECEKLFRVAADGFWEDHYCFENADIHSVSRNQQLIGNERAADIVVNVVLPCLYAYAIEADDLRLSNEITELYNQYPAIADNEITRNVEKWLFPADGKAGAVINGVRQQQGIIYLFKFLCQDGSCARCLEADAF